MHLSLCPQQAAGGCRWSGEHAWNRGTRAGDEGGGGSGRGNRKAEASCQSSPDARSWWLCSPHLANEELEAYSKELACHKTSQRQGQAAKPSAGLTQSLPDSPQVCHGEDCGMVLRIPGTPQDKQPHSRLVGREEENWLSPPQPPLRLGAAGPAFAGGCWGAWREGALTLWGCFPSSLWLMRLHRECKPLCFCPRSAALRVLVFQSRTDLVV